MDVKRELTLSSTIIYFLTDFRQKFIMKTYKAKSSSQPMNIKPY